MIKNDVSQVYGTYARAIDEKRYDLLSQVFHPEAKLEYIVGGFNFSCLGNESAGKFKEFLDLCFWTNHLIGSPSCEQNGKMIFATARVQAVHQQRTVSGKISRWLIRGSYHDHFQFFEDKWLITNRYCHTPDEEGSFLTENVESFQEQAWAPPQKLLLNSSYEI